MNYRRIYHGIIKFNAEIYVFGGFNGEVLSSAEQYDQEGNIWYNCTNMPVSGQLNTCVRVQDSIFITSYKFTLISFTPSTDIYIRY